MSKTWQTVMLAIIAWLIKKWLKPEQLGKVDKLTEIRIKELEVDKITKRIVAEMACGSINLDVVRQLDAKRMSLNREIAALRRELKPD